jgi:hypothetical protein
MTGLAIKKMLQSKVFLNGIVFSRIGDGVDENYRCLVTDRQDLMLPVIMVIPTAIRERSSGGMKRFLESGSLTVPSSGPRRADRRSSPLLEGGNVRAALNPSAIAAVTSAASRPGREDWKY